jgi:hypothetical protein
LMRRDKPRRCQRQRRCTTGSHLKESQQVCRRPRLAGLDREEVAAAGARVVRDSVGRGSRRGEVLDARLAALGRLASKVREAVGTRPASDTACASTRRMHE